ncbi:hypothetical protein LINPERHAP1_LOCUS38318, partial [Linum perenne]
DGLQSHVSEQLFNNAAFRRNTVALTHRVYRGASDIGSKFQPSFRLLPPDDERIVSNWAKRSTGLDVASPTTGWN